MSDSQRKLYGTPISQPTRACYWALLISGLPFELRDVNPLAGETRTPEFRALNPAGTIPVLADADGLVLYESGAILTYLVQRYPDSRLAREFAPAAGDVAGWARVNEYLHWHHHSARQLTLGVFRPMLRERLGLIPARDEQARKTSDQLLKSVLTALSARLERNGGVGMSSSAALSIADIQAYCEVDQLEEAQQIHWADYPLLKAWADRMKTLPHYHESHRALVAFVRQQASL